MLRLFTPIALAVFCACSFGCGNSAPLAGESTVAHAQEPAAAAAPDLPTVAPATATQETAPPDAAVTAAQTLDQASTQVDQLKAQLKELAEARNAEDGATTTTSAPATDVEPSADSEEVVALRAELADLRKDVDRLQETVDAALAYLVGELGAENRRLRTDLANVGENTTETEPPADSPSASPTTKMSERVDYGELGYIAIKEWGRTPEQAAELAASKPGTTVSTLRGMICAVSPGLSDEELAAVGAKIRASCEGYDNVNIDIFDDETAAREFAENNVRSSAHLVMNITRHKTSGQDVMVRVLPNGKREVMIGE